MQDDLAWGLISTCFSAWLAALSFHCKARAFAGPEPPPPPLIIIIVALITVQSPL